MARPDPSLPPFSPRISPQHPKAASMLTVERARQLLSYDPFTGELRWRVDRRGTAKAGAPAGSWQKDRLVIWLDNERFIGPRVIWLIVTGEWPNQFIDHIDGNSRNNRWVNLRDVSPRMNSQNRRKAGSNSHTGLLGVRLDRKSGRYLARISTSDKADMVIGMYPTPEAAHAAYLAAKRIHHEGNTL